MSEGTATDTGREDMRNPVGKPVKRGPLGPSISNPEPPGAMPRRETDTFVVDVEALPKDSSQEEIMKGFAQIQASMESHTKQLLRQMQYSTSEVTKLKAKVEKHEELMFSYINDIQVLKLEFAELKERFEKSLTGGRMKHDTKAREEVPGGNDIDEEMPFGGDMFAEEANLGNEGDDNTEWDESRATSSASEGPAEHGEGGYWSYDNVMSRGKCSQRQPGVYVYSQAERAAGDDGNKDATVNPDRADNTVLCVKGFKHRYDSDVFIEHARWCQEILGDSGGDEVPKVWASGPAFSYKLKFQSATNATKFLQSYRNNTLEKQTCKIPGGSARISGYVTRQCSSRAALVKRCCWHVKEVFRSQVPMGENEELLANCQSGTVFVKRRSVCMPVFYVRVMGSGKDKQLVVYQPDEVWGTWKMKKRIIEDMSNNLAQYCRSVSW